MERRCSIFSLETFLQWISARLTTSPPSEWQTKMIGRSEHSRSWESQ